MSGTVDLHEAINSLWDSSGLDALFSDNWTADEISKYETLNEEEAVPDSPFPYCVYKISPQNVITRMSGGRNLKREIWDVPVEFHIHVKEIDGDNRTAKRIAADLLDELLQVFGGHPTQAPEEMTLDNGHHLITQLQSEYSMRSGDRTHEWVINYIMRLDVPVMSTANN